MTTASKQQVRSDQFDGKRVVGLTFRACRTHWLKLTIAGVVFIAAPHVISAWLLNPFVHPKSFRISAIWLGLAYQPIHSSIKGLYQAWVTLVIIAEAGGGPRESQSELIQRVVTAAGPIVATAVLFTLGFLAGILALIVPGMVLAMAWIVSVPVAATERLGPWAAIRRSMSLTKGHRLDIFGLVVVWVIASTVINIAVGALGSGELSIKAAQQTPLVALVLSPIVGLVSGVVGTVGVAVIYLELATIKEGGTLADVFS
jgi:hypothetical protein